MKSLQESLLDNDDELFDRTDITEEEELRIYIEKNYQLNSSDKIWIKKARKQVEVKCIKLFSSDVETLELPFGYEWDLSYLGSIQIFGCNKLKSLKGCPNYATSVEVRNCNGLTSLEGAPEEVEERFIIDFCENLKSLKGGPIYVGKAYGISYSKNLQNLEGAPKKMKGTFACDHSGITSLLGAPIMQGGTFNCSYCDNLTSLENAPVMEKGRFICSHCKKLTSLEGLHADLSKVKVSAKGCSKNIPVESVMSQFNIPYADAWDIIKK